MNKYGKSGGLCARSINAQARRRVGTRKWKFTLSPKQRRRQKMVNRYWERQTRPPLTEKEKERMLKEMEILYEAARDHGTVIEDEEPDE
jgi:hypothetical protein